MDVNVHDYEIDVFQISFLLLVACSAISELVSGPRVGCCNFKAWM